jgi:hypothetical protein
VDLRERGSDRRKDIYSMRSFMIYTQLINGKKDSLYSLPNIILVIKSGRMRWAAHVAHMGEKRNACRVLGMWE